MDVSATACAVYPLEAAYARRWAEQYQRPGAVAAFTHERMLGALAAQTSLFRGCMHCVSCCSNKQRQRGQQPGRYTTSEGWPGGIPSPLAYFEMRARQLSVLYRACHGPSTWRRMEGVSVGSDLAQRRGMRQLSVLVPASHTNISAHDCTVRFVGVQLASLAGSSAQRIGKGRGLLATFKDAPKRSRVSPRAGHPAASASGPHPGPQAPASSAHAAPAWAGVPGLIPASRGTPDTGLMPPLTGHTTHSWTSSAGCVPPSCAAGGSFSCTAGASFTSSGSASLSLLHTPTPAAGGPATCLSLGASGSLPSSLGPAGEEGEGSSLCPRSAGPAGVGAGPAGVGAGPAPPPGVIFALPPACPWGDVDRASYYSRQLAIKAEQAYSCQQVVGEGQEEMEPGSGAWSMLWSLAGRLTQRRVSLQA
ncbi:hypothetical protein ACKKBG_A38620 [Auxenochlorella protothecoides x Auxenochlorella symbiontica]